jgi:diguanylate cyclase (GGDEF)-like protein
MNNSISQLIQGGHRLWNLTQWFSQTMDYLSTMIKQTLSSSSMSHDDLSLTDKLKRMLTAHDFLPQSLISNVTVGIIFFESNEYVLAEQYIGKAMATEHIHAEHPIIYGLLCYYIAMIQIEKLNFHKANEYFLRGLEILLPATISPRHDSQAHATSTSPPPITQKDMVEYTIRWSNLFIESGNIDISTKYLDFIASHLSPHHHQLYTQLKYYLFLCHKRKHNPQSTIFYANLLLPCDTKFLDDNAWYTVHIFCAEYYTSIARDFEKTIYHFTTANYHLTNTWKAYIKNLNELKPLLSVENYLEIRGRYEEKLYHLMLENNLHHSHNITTLKNAYIELDDVYKQVKEFSITDSLTSLHNRRYLWESSTEFFHRAKLEEVPISCMMIDCNHFKAINDRYGHIQGDHVLVVVCKAISNFFRKSDIVIRFGGDEVLALLYNISRENADKLAIKIKKMIENLDITADTGEKIVVSVSIGISSIDAVQISDARILEKMIDEADKNLYDTKS